MKLPSYLRLSRFGIYVFRRRIPGDILGWFVTNEIRVSLRTGNPSEAISNARILAAETERLFHRLRTNMLTDEDKKKFERMLHAKRLEMRLREKLEKLEEASADHRLHLLEAKRQHEREINLLLSATAKCTSVGASASPLLSTLIAEFLSPIQVKRRADKQSTVRKDSDALHLFLEIVGDKPIRDVRQADAADYADRIRTFKCRGMERSISTVNNHMGSVGKFSGWVQAFHSSCGHDLLQFRSLRYKRMTAPSEEKAMFEPEEVQTLLSHPRFVGLKESDPALYWLIAIAAYSGMRLEEIAQLNPRSDIRTDKDGIPVFDINSNDGKSLKTESSARIVPIHGKLLDDGLMDYVSHIRAFGVSFFPHEKSRDGRLGKNIGKRANRFLKAIIGSEGKTLHSFRHTFTTLLKRGMVEESIAAALVGHVHGGISYSRYGKHYEVKMLKEIVEAHISYYISSL